MTNALHENLGKLTVTGDIGDKLQEQVDQSIAEEQGHVGAGAAFKVASASVLKIGAHVAADFAEGKFQDLDEAQVKDLVEDYLRQAATCCVNLSEQAKAKQHVAAGKRVAAQEALRLVTNYHVSARRRHDALTAPSEDDADGVDGPTKIRGAGKAPMRERKPKAPKEGE